MPLFGIHAKEMRPAYQWETSIPEYISLLLNRSQDVESIEILITDVVNTQLNMT
jgi:hypothetical protein